jgi:hypothetical protein
MMALLSAGVLAGSLLTSRAAEAHAVMTSPLPRVSDNGGDTNGPCGPARAASQPVTNPPLVPGATLNVSWNETITHVGCFIVDFSPANDQNFQLLTTVAHKPGGAGGIYTTTVTLPSAPCAACTLRVRQLNLDPTGAAEPTAAACAQTVAPIVYYSCANVVLAANGGTGGATGTGGRAGTGGATGAGGATGGTGGRTGTGGTVGGSGGSNAGTGGAVVAGSGGATVSGTGGTTVPGTGGTTASGTGGAAEGTGGTGAPGGADSSSGSSCDTVATAPGGLPAVLVGLGVLLTLTLRRRRGRSS